MDAALEAAFAARMDPSRDDDFFDRLLRLYTFGILVGFGTIIGTGTYFGDRIACAVSGEYASTGHVTSFVENYCLLTSTYAVVDINESNAQIATKERLISYYQWIPLIVGISIILLLLPNFLWKSFAPSYRKFPEISRNFNFVLSPEEQEKLVTHASLVVRNVIVHAKSPKQLACTYLFIKVAILCVIVCQMALFQFTLGPVNVLKFLNPNNALAAQNTRFPVMTQCYTHVAAQSTQKKVTIGARCVLPNNILLFYFCVFCIYWFAFLFIVSLGSFIYWCCSLFNEGLKIRYILRRLHCPVNGNDLRSFIRAIGIDGIFMIHMTSKNGSDLFASMLTENLFTLFLQSKLDLDDE